VDRSPFGIAVFAWLACVGACVAASAMASADPRLARLGGGFASDHVAANGTTLHYVRGGSGPALVLLHGFPQDWYAFHRIMPRLARSFTVISMDMRGVGRSAPTTDGYDVANLARDVRELARKLSLGPIYFAGHDNGGMVAYAFARLFPRETRGVMILDVPLPGIPPWDEIKAQPDLWHFGFHQTPDLPERLIAGREHLYFRSFFDRLALTPGAIPDEDVAHYVKAYRGVERLRAGLAFYRHVYPDSAGFNAAARGPLDTPIVLAGGDHATGPANAAIAEALRDRGCRHVAVEVVPNSGHWVVDEQPGIVAGLIERHAAR
jgi:pimeloyl-ACP methyl ester carboxylesterase